MTYTIKAKIKQTKTLGNWFAQTSCLAAQLYNACLDVQFERASHGEKLFSTVDLCAHFRSFSLGSDYKDRTIERATKSTTAWYKSEALRYDIYWKTLEKHQEKPEQTENFRATQLPFFLETDQKIARRNDFRAFVKSLSRNQKIVGQPRYQKSVVAPDRTGHPV